MNLLIVESPAKAQTIKKYLGKDYQVLSSYGHVRDLPKTKLGIDIKRDYKPAYRVLERARNNIYKIKKALQSKENLYLATDYDREGEAIAWHLCQSLGLEETKNKKQETNVQRITFTEITKDALKEALGSPRKIDMDLVDAQQARRILDRLVGYKLSPFLWRKVARGLSAGRVQSVAVRLIVEREREIENFKPQEYWEVKAHLSKQNEPKSKLEAKLYACDDKKIDRLAIKNGKEAKKIKKDLKGAKYKVQNIAKKEKPLYPQAPFRTATLQQEAARRFRYSAKKTMFVAQKLYEAGRITYMRTDSTNLSNEAVKKVREYLGVNLGEKYLPKSARIYKTKSKGAQEAHEAIRPSDPTHIPNQIKNKLSGDEYRLYDLIWKRTIASQATPAKISENKIKISAENYTFLSLGRNIIFDGFLKIYPLNLTETTLPSLSVGEILDLIKLETLQKFTKPPSRYTEASLVRELEKRGIGRPSTYAPTMSTVQTRGYVHKEGPYFYPLDIGVLVNDILVEHFPEIVDYSFTATMENDLDGIASGKLKWVGVVDEFYKPFAKHLQEKDKIVKKEEVAQKKTGKKCKNCNGEIIIKMGRYGRFYACSNFPECKFKEPMKEKKIESPEAKKRLKEAEELLKKHPKCEKCGKDMVVRTSRFGTFLGCSNYPKCKQIVSIQEDLGSCPKCKKGNIVKRFSKKKRQFYGCSRYPKCNFASWQLPGKDK